MRELGSWAPSLRTVLYHGSKADRELVAKCAGAFSSCILTRACLGHFVFHHPISAPPCKMGKGPVQLVHKGCSIY